MNVAPEKVNLVSRASLNPLHSHCACRGQTSVTQPIKRSACDCITAVLYAFVRMSVVFSCNLLESKDDAVVYTVHSH